MRHTGFSRVFGPDAPYSAEAARLLGDAERQVEAARVAALALAGLSFATAGAGTRHVRRDGEDHALCGQVVRAQPKGLAAYECLACGHRTVSVLGVWIFGERAR